MAYLLKQKFNLRELAEIGQKQKKVLIHEPDEYLAALYAHYLRTDNFNVSHCADASAIREIVGSFKPQVLVFSIDAPQSFFAASVPTLFSSLILDFPGLLFITTGSNESGKYLGELMLAGVCGHLNRRLTRPKDLAAIVKSILN